MKVTVSRECKGREILFEDIWYRKDVDYEVDFSLAMRMKQDRSFVVEMPYERFEYDPKLWVENKSVALIEDIDPISGWGNVGVSLVRYSPDINFSLVGKRWGVPDNDVRNAARRPVNEHGGAIWHEQPRHEWITSPFGRNIAITPFETTRVPKSWVSRFNSMDAVLVPCKHNQQMMFDSGVRVPVDLISWGIDTELFHPVERSKNRPFTFGHMGALSIRKGTDLVVKAFLAAFPRERDVRLICKTSNNIFQFWVKDDKRIVVNMEKMGHEDLLQRFFGEIDVGIFPTRGEGWGLPITECMATGAPVITTGWSGPLEFANNEDGWLLDYSMVPATEFSEKVYQEDCGDWAEPSFEHLVACMRNAYENRDETARKGATAAARMKKDFDWEVTIKQFHEAINTHLIGA
jgi:glycosyltransferase involved in cell wall biosynthesis